MYIGNQWFRRHLSYYLAENILSDRRDCIGLDIYIQKK